jgi:hypothetical protein
MGGVPRDAPALRDVAEKGYQGRYGFALHARGALGDNIVDEPLLRC